MASWDSRSQRRGNFLFGDDDFELSGRRVQRVDNLAGSETETETTVILIGRSAVAAAVTSAAVTSAAVASNCDRVRACARVRVRVLLLLAAGSAPACVVLYAPVTFAAAALHAAA